MGEVSKIVVLVREFNQEKDCLQVEQVERNCEMSPNGKISLCTHMLGDPISRIRNSPAFLMLVAEVEMDTEKKIVGLIRGSIKTVACGKTVSIIGKEEEHHKLVPIYTKLAYILGLRVSASSCMHHRYERRVNLHMEKWFREHSAEYSYMTTEKGNEASLALFTQRCGYSKFRTPSILVQPVFVHEIKITTRAPIIRVTPVEAETLYRRYFSTIEFFPHDIDSILNHKLNLGTFVAVQSKTNIAESWPGMERFLSDPPQSWAVLSIWNNQEVFKLEVCGASPIKRVLAKTTRIMDRVFPWMGIPSVPNIFRPFGLYFLYGLGGNGSYAGKLVKALCGFAHNLARNYGCSMIATEVSGKEPLRVGIPYWGKVSFEEDMWCMKRLEEDFSDGPVGDWTKSSPGMSIFVDPREL